jgi:hypothetical protein
MVGDTKVLTLEGLERKKERLGGLMGHRKCLEVEPP